MTNDSTIQMKMQKEQHEHELRVALINAFAHDPELKYYVGAAVGAGVATVAALFGEVVAQQTEEEKAAETQAAAEGAKTWRNPITGIEYPVHEHKKSWGWVLPAAAAISPGGVVSNVGIGAIASWLTQTKEGKAAGEELGLPTDWPTTISGIATLGAGGFAGFCISILYLKAICGEKGITGLLSAVV